jgi:hypothetical protein
MCFPLHLDSISQQSQVQCLVSVPSRWLGTVTGCSGGSAQESWHPGMMFTSTLQFASIDHGPKERVII